MAYKNFFKAKQLRPSNNLREYLGLIGVPRGEMLFSFPGDRKSTRLNSSHDQISYAVFCLKKKKKRPSSISERTATRITTRAYSARHPPARAAQPRYPLLSRAHSPHCPSPRQSVRTPSSP